MRKKQFQVIIFGVIMISFCFGQNYKNTELSFEKRVDDLISHMTLEEKISQMENNAPEIPRLDIPEYNWWNECLHGVARAGIATVFPQAIGLAATWNPELMFEVANVISDEARAKHHEFVRKGERDIYKGLTMWSPNINIFRDPRWGRGHETYGEDPFLTGKMGVQFVKGLQGNDPKYLKLVSTPKHYAVHSGPEPDRHRFDAISSKQDMFETYLPAFETCIKDGKAYSVMGAYNRTNGEACCASPYLLQDILRDKWGFEGYVVSDCGAISDIWRHHKIVNTAPEAAALAVKSGCELNCGNQYPNLFEAVELGLITEQEIDIAVKRLFLARFKLGLFDDTEKVSYAQIPYSVNNCEKHQKLSIKTAQESIVLLKNKGNVLPLSKDLNSIAVIGPNADDVEVSYGNYNGIPVNPVSILQGIKNKLGDKVKIRYTKGCEIAKTRSLKLSPIPKECLSELKGEYYNNTDLSGKPELIRNDKSINFDWKENGPCDEVGKDNFSIRWTGYFTPDVSGEYHLGVTSDDGFRLFIDDKQIVEIWRDQPPTTGSEKINLKANKKYKIKIEYYENSGGASCKFVWLKPGFEENYPKHLIAETKKAIEIANKSDVVLVVGGISPRLEGEEMRVEVEGFEGGDRISIQLPSPQRALLKELKKTGKPVILVLLNGSALGVKWEDENVPAILSGWYPGQKGGTAIADVIFGDYNPAGRLPVTFYNSVDDLPDFEDYKMDNRTYKYFKGKPIYPFGHGLSYSDFQYKKVKISRSKVKPEDEVTVSVNVKNNSKFDGDEVVQIYANHSGSKNWRANKVLVGFKRIHIKSGKQQKVEIPLKVNELRIWSDKNDDYIVEKGKYELLIGKSSDNIVLKSEIIVK